MFLSKQQLLLLLLSLTYILLLSSLCRMSASPQSEKCTC
jgi:hypothetical protein